MNIYPAYISKYNSKCEKTNHSFNSSKQRRVALPCSKKISALLRGIMSKHGGDFYCLNCLHSCSIQKANLDLIKKKVKISIFVVLLWFLKKTIN